jgi:hypothetical protein
MYELIPIFSGVVAGVVCARLDLRSMRLAVVVSVATIAAVVAAFASGEVYESWAFLLWDFAQTVIAAAFSSWASHGILRSRRRA